MMIKFLMMILPIYGSTTYPYENITPGMEGQIKEWLEKIDLCAKRQLGPRPLKISLGACRQLSTPFITLLTSLKRGFDSLKKTMYHQRLQYHNALLAYNLWTKGMLLRCLRITLREEQIDEYETYSDDEETDFEEHTELVNRACVKDPLNGED